MSENIKYVTLSLKVMINRERSKVLFAEADCHFVDILLSFLTLPLGRIMKVVEKHYGDEAATIGSLSSLYHSLANLDSSHFWTEGAKETLLNPTSSFEAEYERLKLDITDFQPAEYFVCDSWPFYRFRSVCMYYDHVNACPHYKCSGFHYKMQQEVAKKGSQAASVDGVFAIHTESFIISDDLQILPHERGLLGIISYLGLTDMDNAEPIKVDFGFSEIMNLLKASLTSPTPLSDLILNKTSPLNTAIVKSHHEQREDNPNSRYVSLKVMTQKSTGKFLYAQANKEFIEFLFGLLYVPLGGVEHLLAGKTCIKAIDNLYRTTADLIYGRHLKSSDMKKRLMNPNLPHGYISENHILPLTQECLPFLYTDNLKWFSSVKFPKGQGNYLQGSRTYQVADDLTVTPFCIVSILSSLREQKIAISDVKEVEMQIGLKEALSILKASLHLLLHSLMLCSIPNLSSNSQREK